MTEIQLENIAALNYVLHLCIVDEKKLLDQIIQRNGNTFESEIPIPNFTFLLYHLNNKYEMVNDRICRCQSYIW